MKEEGKQAKSIFFATLGCRLNRAETEGFRNDALIRGFRLVSNENEADIYVLNSCSVTDKAQRDTNKILKRLSGKYPGKELIVMGCGARDEHKKYAVVVKNDEKNRLFSNLSSSGLTRGSTMNIDSRLRGNDNSCKTRLMVKVQDGCNNRCSYCIVSYLRGRERSLGVDGIIDNFKIAQKRGFNEVVLCGVNVGKYSYEGINLAGLIKKILENTTFERIRLSSINPDDFSDDLIHLWAQNKRLCPHFHISLQSGSDTVLARMRRKYNTKQYAGLVAKLRKEIKDVMITTDIIVGFPGETEKEFAETVDFVRKMKFLKVHVFRYSKREGTQAATMEGQVPEKTKKEGAVRLQKLESEIRDRILKKYIGKEVEVLFEQKKNGKYAGFTPNYIKVVKNSKKDLTNQIRREKVAKVTANELVC
jgi:threonylcarbamoyladenosine tRNA methylthiotransferase MtaB